MREIFALSALRARGRLIALPIGFGLFELVVALSYASVDQNAIRQVVESLPPALQALSGEADIASPSGYLGSAYAHPVALTIQGAFVISVAATVTRDLEERRAELLLSRPLPVWKWLLAQELALALGLALVALGGFLGGLIGILSVDALGSVGIGALAAVSVGGYLVFLTIGAVSLVIAAFAPTGARAIGLAAGFVLVSYALDYLADVWTVAEPLGPLSVFHYYDPGVILGDGAIPAADVIGLLVVTVAAAVAAHLMFSRRELAR